MIYAIVGVYVIVIWCFVEIINLYRKIWYLYGEIACLKMMIGELKNNKMT